MANVYVAGHSGMVGSAIVRHLEHDANVRLLVASHRELDLTNQHAVRAFFDANAIDQVYLAAAKVGGIGANSTYPAEFIFQNLMIQTNVIDAAHHAGVARLLFLGSSCIYPKLAPQPMSEDVLLTGRLEETNDAYAIAKIAGLKMCEAYRRQYGDDFRSVMPTNLYGPNDNFHPEHSHVIPALMRRFHEAKIAGEHELVVWGTGTPRREFLHVDDMASASAHMMNLEREAYDAATSPHQTHINIGSGQDLTIRELAEAIARVVGYEGAIRFDASKPDGTPRKLLDVALAQSLGWSAAIEIDRGISETYTWLLRQEGEFRS
jgi:GDP-L-fucose synthase